MWGGEAATGLMATAEGKSARKVDLCVELSCASLVACEDRGDTPFLGFDRKDRQDWEEEEEEEDVVCRVGARHDFHIGGWM